jgi:hypothetical protein
MDQLSRINTFFWKANTIESDRTRADVLVSYQALFRSENTRHADLSDCYPYEIKGMGPQECTAFVVGFDECKTEKHGKTQVGVLARNREWSICGVFAIFLYLFGRFHTKEERIPDLLDDGSWSKIPLFKNKKGTHQTSDNQSSA